MLVVLSICVSVLGGGNCGTASTSPCAKATLREPPVLGGIRVDKNSLHDAIAVLGPAPIVESGDAGAYRARVCYASPTGVVVFFDSNSLGGSRKEITSAGVARSDAYGAGTEQCGVLKVKAAALSVAGLSLGTTGSDVSRLLGKPQEESDGRLKYCCLAFEPMAPQDREHFERAHPPAAGTAPRWSVYGEISIAVRAGRVARLEVTRTTSY